MERRYDNRWGIYKGTGVARFQLVPAFYDELPPKEGSSYVWERVDTKPAGVYVEVAPGDRGTYNWDSKVMIKLGIPDISKIIKFATGSEERLSLTHDPGAGTDSKGQRFKGINFSKLPGGNFMFDVSENEVGEDRSKKVVRQAKVAISSEEMLTLVTLLRAAIPYLVGWHFPTLRR